MENNIPNNIPNNNYSKTMMDEDKENVYPEIIALRCSLKIESDVFKLTITEREQSDFNISKHELFYPKNKLKFIKDFLNEIPELNS